ncbi:MAG: DegT/DnrJ/EryC1/StrS aminotransferase family protein [Alphaproteobacteria bacterium]|nr:DegT/DnrJ/EryC1/StrS aminotransferase family protein [Alphaproteobacteria bacterium]
MDDAPGRGGGSQAIAFIDLQAQRRRIGPRLDAAIAAVLAHGQFILGPEVRALEEALARHCGAAHAVTCSNGTDALLLALMALGAGRGDAVFVPAYTFAATAEAVALAGATPVLVDCQRGSATMDPQSLAAAIEATDRGGSLRPAGIIPVDLFGQPADYPAIGAVAARHGLWILADAAQSYGGALNGKRVGTLARATATSFFPSKPLGCYGDGGAVLTDDPALAALLRSLQQHGRGSGKHEHLRIGLNARLDTLQAAILLEKLAILDDELAARDAVAARYAAGLGDVATVPTPPPGLRSAWALYAVQVTDRARAAARLEEAGVPTRVYYERPLHRQPAYRDFPCAPGGLAQSDALAEQALCLPMHPYLEADAQDRVIAAVRKAVA